MNEAILLLLATFNEIEKGKFKLNALRCFLGAYRVYGIKLILCCNKFNISSSSCASIINIANIIIH